MIDYRDEPVAILIENEFFAHSFNTLFNNLWDGGKVF